MISVILNAANEAETVGRHRAEREKEALRRYLYRTRQVIFSCSLFLAAKFFGIASFRTTA